MGWGSRVPQREAGVPEGLERCSEGSGHLGKCFRAELGLTGLSHPWVMDTRSWDRSSWPIPPRS